MPKKLTLDQVIQMMREAVINAGSLRKLAKQWGISASYLSNAIRGLNPPGPSVCKRLGVRRVDVHHHYEKIS